MIILCSPFMPRGRVSDEGAPSSVHSVVPPILAKPSGFLTVTSSVAPPVLIL